MMKRKSVRKPTAMVIRMVCLFIVPERVGVVTFRGSEDVIVSIVTTTEGGNAKNNDSER